MNVCRPLPNSTQSPALDHDSRDRHLFCHILYLHVHVAYKAVLYTDPAAAHAHCIHDGECLGVWYSKAPVEGGFTVDSMHSLSTPLQQVKPGMCEGVVLRPMKGTENPVSTLALCTTFPFMGSLFSVCVHIYMCVHI